LNRLISFIEASGQSCYSNSMIPRRRCAVCLLICLLGRTAPSQETPEAIPLWPNGAPGFESRRNEPELSKDYWVRNIHNPSITVFLPPREKATGAAVVICPGGGHRELVFNAEGVDPARYFNTLGVAAFVLKYRLAREASSPYSIEKHPKEDARRAMRLVRSRAREWNLDPKRIGIMGFSAGGEVVAMVVYSPADGDPTAADPIERLSCRPDFQIVIYPGPLGVPDIVPAQTPPAFFLAANDDVSPAGTITTLLDKFRRAGVPAEVHLFARGGHGFNMGYRSKLATIKGWPQRMAEWMADSGILSPRPSLESGARE
jgi:acetyl esterase/lipase